MKTGKKSFDLAELLRFVLSKIILIAIIVGVIAGIAAIYVCVVVDPKYEATAQIYVVNSKDSVINLSDLQLGTYLTSDYQLVFDTWEVNQMVISNLNLPYSVGQLQNMVKVTNPNNTRVLFITVTSEKAAEAALIANEFAEVASEYISSTMQAEKPTLLSQALEPLYPVSPRKTLVISVAAFLAGIVTLWLLFIVFICDEKIKNSSDILKCTGELPLAEIPIMDLKRDH